MSDGGLLTAVLEMAFAGDKGLEVSLPAAPEADRGSGDALAEVAAAFAEEIGLVIEVSAANEAEVVAAMAAASVPCVLLGSTTAAKHVKVAIGGGAAVVDAPLSELRDLWEATSFELEKRQCAADCVAQEKASLANRQVKITKGPRTLLEPSWHLR